jgi:tetratricopeptide (TPR) repeat protein
MRAHTVLMMSGFVLFGGIVLGGCQSQSKPNDSAQEAVGLYESKQYGPAYEQGKRGMDDTESDLNSRQHARLIAGLSANEMKRYAEARQLLGPLTTSDDTELAGHAAAGMGLAYIGAEDYSSASRYLSQGGRQLKGDEAARAFMFAGDCDTLLGRVTPARNNYQSALGLAKDPALYAQIQKKLNTEGFTVQVGAYTNKANADRTLAGLRSRTPALGLPAPTMMVDRDATGRTLYLVQVGRFAKLDDARTAMAKLGREAVVRQVAK